MKLAMLQLLVLTKACVMLAVMVNCMNASRPQVYCSELTLTNGRLYLLALIGSLIATLSIW